MSLPSPDNCPQAGGATGRVPAILWGMHKLLLAKLKTAPRSKRGIALIGAVLLAGIAAAIWFWPPQRSAAAYCKVLTAENARLAGRSPVSHASDYATKYSRLEQVAPNEIKADVRVGKLAFQKIASDPTQAISASLSGMSAEANLNAWDANHCQSNK